MARPDFLSSEFLRLSELVENPRWFEQYRRFEARTLVGAAALGLLGENSIRKNVRRAKHRIYRHLEELLAEDLVALAPTGENYDQERQPIDRLIVHHTKTSPLTPGFLNAMSLVRLYVPHFAAKKDAEGLYSGHFLDGRQVFWPYHWLIHESGESTRLLGDDQIGWHAGNWDVNTRSAALAFVGDFTNSVPNPAALQAARDIIAENYSHVDLTPETLLGHRETNPKTVCPGEKFVPEWKAKLLG